MTNIKAIRARTRFSDRGSYWAPLPLRMSAVFQTVPCELTDTAGILFMLTDSPGIQDQTEQQRTQGGREKSMYGFLLLGETVF